MLEEKQEAFLLSVNVFYNFSIFSLNKFVLNEYHVEWQLWSGGYKPQD